MMYAAVCTSGCCQKNLLYICLSLVRSTIHTENESNAIESHLKECKESRKGGG